MTKEDIIKTLRSEGLDVNDHEHILMLKAENQEQIETFKRRISELNFRNSYGWYGPKDRNDTSENLETETINETVDNSESEDES